MELPLHMLPLCWHSLIQAGHFHLLEVCHIMAAPLSPLWHARMMLKECPSPTSCLDINQIVAQVTAAVTVRV